MLAWISFVLVILLVREVRSINDLLRPHDYISLEVFFMSGAMHPLLQYAFMAWFLVKTQG
jgi:hypothetical protein